MSHNAPQVELAVVGDRIRRIRIQMGLSVRDLAKLADLSKTSIVAIEQGKSFRMSTLLKVCTAMGLHVDGIIQTTPETEVPFAIHREKDDRWFDLADFAGGPVWTGALDQSGLSEIVENGCKSPLNILASRLSAGRVKPTIMELFEKSETRSHAGEEFVHVLRGSAKIVINDSEIVLAEGESVTFWSGEPHSYGPAVPGSPAKIVSVRVDS